MLDATKYKPNIFEILQYLLLIFAYFLISINICQKTKLVLASSRIKNEVADGLEVETLKYF